MNSFETDFSYQNQLKNQESKPMLDKVVSTWGKIKIII